MTCEERFYSNDYRDLIVSFSEDISDLSFLKEEDCLNQISERISILHDERTEEYLTNLETIPYSSIPKLFGLMDSTNMEVTGVKQVQNPSFLGLNGSGTIVGIIDTGIMYDNPLFLDENGNSRIGVIWDQSLPAGEIKEQDTWFLPPYFGTVYFNEDINRALSMENPYEYVKTKDENGHGTFLAGISAGGVDEEHDFTGIATRAEIAVVKLKEAKPYLREFFQIKDGVEAYSESDIMYAVDYLVRYAKLRGKPMSILLGMGSNNGGHNGQTYLEIYINRLLENVGIMVSAPAGNEGAQRLHYAGVWNETKNVGEVELNISEGQSGLVFEFWGHAPTTFAIGLVSPRGERIDRVVPRFGKEEILSLPQSRTSIYIAYQILEAFSGDELIFVRLQNPIAGLWRILVYSEEGSQKRFHIWLPLRQFLQSDTFFLDSSPEQTITVPGNAERITTLTAYDNRNGSIYAQASRGYNTKNQVKPNLAAPGVEIVGPGLRNNLVTKSGSSVAAAHSAGMFALFFQWDMENYRSGMFFSSQIQSFFQRGAQRERQDVYPNPIWGYGKMNIEQSLEQFSIINISPL